MSFLEAYCNKCAALAGTNGYECDRCAGLPHIKPTIENEEGKAECYGICPSCGFKDNIAVPGNFECCGKCGKEYVSEEVE